VDYKVYHNDDNLYSITYSDDINCNDIYNSYYLDDQLEV